MKHFLCLVGFTMIASVVARGEGYQNKMPVDAADALTDSGEVTLFLLDPSAEKPHGLTLHGNVELGRVRLNQTEAKIATEALRQAIDASNGDQAMCFEPRHGLRVVTASHTFDFVFCYECMSVVIFRDDKYEAELPIKGSPKTLNAILQKHHIPISYD